MCVPFLLSNFIVNINRYYNHNLQYGKECFTMNVCFFRLRRNFFSQYTYRDLVYGGMQNVPEFLCSSFPSFLEKKVYFHVKLTLLLFYVSHNFLIFNLQFSRKFSIFYIIFLWNSAHVSYPLRCLIKDKKNSQRRQG